MRVTSWAEYGLLASLHLARHAGEGPIAAREMAVKERLPADYVEQILLRLRRAGLVQSVRGARGGYLLARSPASITVKDVLAASERGTFETPCERHTIDLERCGPDRSCSVRPVWQILQRRIDETLDSICLADLLQEEDEVRALVGLDVGVV
jgi:Rrf2 family protein